MAAGVGSSSGSRAGERSGAVAGGVGAQNSGGFGGGNRGQGGNFGKPAGPGFSPKYDSLTPNGNRPPTGVIDGVRGLVDAVVSGNAYGHYGRPTGWADTRSRDLGGIGRGNTGGKDPMGLAASGGPAPLQSTVFQTLIGMNPQWKGALQSQGHIPPAMVPPANQVRASLLKGGSTDPKPWWRTPFPAPGGNRPPKAV